MTEGKQQGNFPYSAPYTACHHPAHIITKDQNGPAGSELSPIKPSTVYPTNSSKAEK